MSRPSPRTGSASCSPSCADLPLTRTALPNLRAVNIVVEGLLGEGVAYNARFDPQAKGLGEWLRSRVVEMPEELVADRPAGERG